MKNLSEVKVLPINQEKINKFINEGRQQDAPILEIRFNQALVKWVPIVTDKECIHWDAEYKIVGGKPTLCVNLDVYQAPKSFANWDGSISRETQMFPVGFIDIPLAELIEKYCDQETDLITFMGSRHNYNPRIEGNQKLILRNINEALSQ